jgi:SAM-dependent methyltransferase
VIEEQEQRLTNVLRCPVCHGAIEVASAGKETCSRCGYVVAMSAGVRLLAGGPDSAAARFYSAADEARYGRVEMNPQFDKPVRAFLEQLPASWVVVELGSGAGAFDGAHPGYVATDYSLFALQHYSTGARVQADAQDLPFADASVDAFFSVATLEHVPNPARALAEIDRCLKPGGMILLYPAWYVRPWAAKALAVRPYSDLTLADRIRKASIPLRDGKVYQFARVVSGRVRREAALALGRRIGLSYTRLDPNLSEHVTSDSDAFVSLDPQAVSAYFLSRGYGDLARSTAPKRLLYGYEPVIVKR